MKTAKAILAFNSFNPCGLLELAPISGSTWETDKFVITITDSPKEASVLFVAGYQTPKSMEKVKSIFDQMPNPKTVVAIGPCAQSGGTYWDSYNTVKRLTDYIPIDVYIPGCPARPEAILEGCEKIFE